MQKIEFVYHFRAFTFELFSTFVYMFGMWQFVVYELNEAEPCIAQDDTNQSWNAQISGQQYTVCQNHIFRSKIQVYANTLWKVNLNFSAKIDYFWREKSAEYLNFRAKIDPK